MIILTASFSSFECNQAHLGPEITTYSKYFG